MADFLHIMVGPFVACLILTGIHAYLGLHIIQRGVIFVDLALAQMAALGATVGFLFGFELHSLGGYLTSLTFALLGALAFALTRLRKPVVPQEAIIGIVYAVAGAASILVLSRTPEGGEDLKALMVGHLLFITWEEIVKILLLYAVIGAVHWIFRHRFLSISSDPELAFQQGINVRLWDFLFYASFAFVVTSSVEIAGVLLVFSFLITPAVCGALLSETIRGRLLVGWVVSFFTSVVGVAASYLLDFPTGATVVVTFGAALIVCAGLTRFRPTST